MYLTVDLSFVLASLLIFHDIAFHGHIHPCPAYLLLLGIQFSIRAVIRTTELTFMCRACPVAIATFNTYRAVSSDAEVPSEVP